MKMQIYTVIDSVVVLSLILRPKFMFLSHCMCVPVINFFLPNRKFQDMKETLKDHFISKSFHLYEVSQFIVNPVMMQHKLRNYLTFNVTLKKYLNNCYLKIK